MASFGAKHTLCLRPASHPRANLNPSYKGRRTTGANRLRQVCGTFRRHLLWRHPGWLRPAGRDAERVAGGRDQGQRSHWIQMMAPLAGARRIVEDTGTAPQ